MKEMWFHVQRGDGNAGRVDAAEEFPAAARRRGTSHPEPSVQRSAGVLWRGQQRRRCAQVVTAGGSAPQ